MAKQSDKGSVEWDDQEGLDRLFIGRSIVKAEDGKLTLDNGKVLTVHANEGCGGCDEGWYELDYLVTFPNVITAVEGQISVDNEWTSGPDSLGTCPEDVRLFVYSEGIGAEVIHTAGHDNGYYGTGFWIETQTKEGN